MEQNNRTFCTAHAKRRARKRLGVPKTNVQSIAERAYCYGVRYEQTKSSLHRYFEGIARQGHLSVNDIRVYHRSVYIFDCTTLITVFPLPRKYHGVADNLERKSQISNDKGEAD